jgi:hypothetical protein
MTSKITTPAWIKVAFIAILMLTGGSTFGVTLEQLRNTPNLTPQRFARLFADFEFKEHTEVQTPEVFLSTQSGDCDDYATLAAMILREKGYTVRLIAVRMPKETHVVAYVEETGSYLDYNNRGYLIKTISCKASLPAIAAKVGKSFESDWTSVSEFTFVDSVKRMVATVSPNGEVVTTPKLLAKATTAKIDINF